MPATIKLNAGGPPVVVYGVEIALVKATTTSEGTKPTVQQAVITVTPLNQPPAADRESKIEDRVPDAPNSP